MLNIALIGCGQWGPNLVRNFALNPRCRLTYVCDLDTARLKSIRERLLGVETVTDYREMLQDDEVDAVLVATPITTHYQIVRDSLEAGKHVLSEKPLTENYRSSLELADIAESVNRTLMVGYVFLFNAAVRKTVEYIRSGDLGQIQYVHAVRTNLGPIRYDVNALWDLASHDVAILLHCLEEMPASVSCTGGRFIGNPQPDVATLILSFPSGRMGFLYVSWLDPRKVRQITFVGTKKMLLFDDLGVLEPLRIYDKGVQRDAYSDTYGAHLMAVRSGEVVLPHVSGSEPLAEECQAFVSAVLDGVDNPGIGKLPLQVAAVLSAAEASLNNNGSGEKIQC